MPPARWQRANSKRPGGAYYKRQGARGHCKSRGRMTVSASAMEPSGNKLTQLALEPSPLPALPDGHALRIGGLGPLSDVPITQEQFDQIAAAKAVP